MSTRRFARVGRCADLARSHARAEADFGIIDASAPEPPETPKGAPDEQPPWPEEQENYRVAAAEDEDCKLEKELSADESYGSRFPEIGDGLAGHGDTVEGADGGNDGEEAAGVQGEVKDEVGSEARNDQAALEAGGKIQSRAQPTDGGVGERTPRLHFGSR